MAPGGPGPVTRATEEGWLEVTAPEPRWKLTGLAFVVVMTSYLHWVLAALGALAALCAAGGPWGRAAAAVLVVSYIPSYCDGSSTKTGRPWDWARRHPAWWWCHDYVRARATRTAELDPGDRYLFGWHPHGILVLSRIFAYGGFWEALFPGVSFRVLGASAMFAVPMCREVCLWHRAVDAGRRTAERCADEGHSLIVYPGGSKEIFHTDPSSDDTVLQVRKGFVRLALRRGLRLVPVLVFGEKACYRRWFPPAWARDACLALLRVPLLLFWGRWGSLVPLPCRLEAVFGAPLPAQEDADPSQEAVDELHGRYVAALRELFEQHKARAGRPRERLVIL